MKRFGSRFDVVTWPLTNNGVVEVIAVVVIVISAVTVALALFR